MASKGAAVHYAEAFRQPLERFVTDIGMPRTDILFGDGVDRIKAAVRERYRLPEGKRVILYAPTFRGDDHAARHVARRTSTSRRCIASSARTTSCCSGCIRSCARASRSRRSSPAFAIDASDHPDIHELMLVSDVLVTDYSSAIFEFSLLGRPMAFFAPDHDDYMDERGFYFDYRTGVPGPVFETTEELAHWLRAGTFDLERVERFRAESFEVADGHASERFVDRVVLPALR